MEFSRKTTRFPSSAHSKGLYKPARLLFDQPSLGELADFLEAESTNKLKEKIQENYDQKVAALTERIKALEGQEKTPEEIKEILQREKAKLLQEAINKSLQDLRIQRTVKGERVDISYLELVKHPDPQVRGEISAIYTTFEQKLGGDINQAVDQYLAQKVAATGKATEGIKAGLEPFDPELANQETDQLQQILDQRSKILSKSKTGLEKLKIDRAEAYLARTSLADSLTAPDGGVIDNYETDLKFWSSEVTNEKNPVRYRLQGFLYANDIFAGGGKPGQLAINEAIKEPRKYYLDHWPDKLTMSDLDSRMSLKGYFKKAQEYSDYDRVIGTIAGLLRLADQNISDPDQLKRYKKYLTDKFEGLPPTKGKQNEEDQLKHLYGIQSFAEFIEADPHWRAELDRIDSLTDPTAPDAKIDDYPGIGKFDKDNKTRWQLNGYLYSVYLFNGKNKASADKEFERAAKMFKASGLIDHDFTQEMIENDSKGKNDGFGLKPFLAKAADYSKYEQVKGIIAGLFKQASEITDPTRAATYKSYLKRKFRDLSPDDSEEAQMVILSTVSSPEETEKEVKNGIFSSILEAAIAASKQHNQVSLEKKFQERFNKDPQTMSLDEINTLAKDVKVELDKFVKERSDTALQSIQSKYDALVGSNGKLKTPLYGPDDLNPLAKSIEDNDKAFAKAKAIFKEPNLDAAINNHYLADLTEAEKSYFNLVEQLDAKQKAVTDQATAKAPDQDKLPPTTGPSENPDQPEADPYLADWAKAPRLSPVYGDYVGVLVADGSASNDPVIARDENGRKIREIPNMTELTRTSDDAKELARQVQYLLFIRVTDAQGQKLWLPEEMLYRHEDYDVPAVTPPEKPLEKPAEKLKYGATYWDVIFNRVSQEVETNSLGSTFDFIYNGLSVGTRVQKLPDGYHLTWNNPEVGTGNIVFSDMSAIRAYCEDGRLYQRLAMQTLLDRRNWDRFQSERWLDKLKDEPQRTGPWSLSIELDWKRNDAFETGNGKVDLSVERDGRIRYRIRKDHVGAAGQNERTGYASDFTQLVQAINHAKTWSENYEGQMKSPEFPSRLEHERALAELMDAKTFEKLSRQIGEKYFFNNFYNFGYAFMYLNWEQERDLFARNRSLNNPILELKLAADNSINWKLVNRSGQNSAWVGINGVARDITDLAYQIEKVKNDPAKNMTKPAQNLPNLGNLGYKLY